MNLQRHLKLTFQCRDYLMGYIGGKDSSHIFRIKAVYPHINLSLCAFYIHTYCMNRAAGITHSPLCMGTLSFYKLYCLFNIPYIIQSIKYTENIYTALNSLSYKCLQEIIGVILITYNILPP